MNDIVSNFEKIYFLEFLKLLNNKEYNIVIGHITFNISYLYNIHPPVYNESRTKSLYTLTYKMR